MSGEKRDAGTQREESAKSSQYEDEASNNDSSNQSLHNTPGKLYTPPPLEDFAWRRVESERVTDCRIFQVRRDLALNPRGGGEHNFYCIEAVDWINIIPLTARNEVVMIEQYRHGADEVTLEIPGGMVDEDETAETAAARELVEETGYRAREVLMLGRTRPNPAIQNNWLYSFLARDCRFEQEPAFDSSEWTVMRLVPLANIPALIAEGAITHALVIAAFHWLSLYRQDLLSSA
ncbi:MAG TPA: NUDIX hydrolase [Pyrinomonadaceae bacterium]|jgi:8-oxo-dGTP pyrophosphatase MutT (NUDIX family)